MTRALLVGILALSLTEMTEAQETRYAGDFMDLGVGARELAMGSTAAALEGGVASWWSVSLLSTVDRDRLLLHHSFFTEGLANLDFLGYSRKLGKRTAVSASVLRFAVDGIPRFEGVLDPEDRAEREENVDQRPSGQPTGYFDAQDLGFRLSLARWTERIIDFGWLYSPFPVKIGVGTSIKYINQSLDENIAVGLGGDVGAHFQLGGAEMVGWDFLGDFLVAVALTDIAGTKITWDTASRAHASMPMRVRLDAGYVQDLDILDSQVSLSYAKVWDLDEGGRDDRGLGVEWAARDALFLRVGRHREDLTAGLGVRAWKLQLDYAFLASEALDTHRVDLTFFPWD